MHVYNMKNITANHIMTSIIHCYSAYSCWTLEFVLFYFSYKIQSYSSYSYRYFSIQVQLAGLPRQAECHAAAAEISVLAIMILLTEYKQSDNQFIAVRPC